MTGFFLAVLVAVFNPAMGVIFYLAWPMFSSDMDKLMALMIVLGVLLIKGMWFDGEKESD